MRDIKLKQRTQYISVKKGAASKSKSRQKSSKTGLETIQEDSIEHIEEESMPDIDELYAEELTKLKDNIVLEAMTIRTNYFSYSLSEEMMSVKKISKTCQDVHA